MSKHSHHHHKKCQSCHKHSPHYHKHCHHHHHKHHDHHHHKRHCYHHKRHYRHHVVCPECPPTPPTVTTYRCSGWPSYVCNPVTDGTGFATLDECQRNCSGAPPTAPLLGSASNFRVLANSTITNTGATIVNGDLGLSPGSAVVGFPPGTVIGTQYVADATAAQAQIDLTTAWNAITAMPFVTDLTGQDLGGMTLAPSVYKYDTSAQLTGNLILDAGGDTAAVWVFKIGSTLTTANVSSVTIINGGQADNVYWQVGSSATLGLGTQFVGNVLAQASITLQTGANISGRALARTAAVTLATSIVAP